MISMDLEDALAWARIGYDAASLGALKWQDIEAKIRAGHCSGKGVGASLASPSRVFEASS